MLTITDPTDGVTAPDATAAFLAHLSRFESCARFAFRRVTCPDTRADRVAEAVGLAWRHFAALAARGKRPELFVTTLALRCTQAVRAGRRLAGCETSRDVLSAVAQTRHHFAVVGLPGHDRAIEHHPLPDELAEALAVSTRTGIPEQAAFRLDFPRWRATLRRRDRAVLDALAAGERPTDVARRFGLSKGRISQLRSEFEQCWWEFQED